LRTTALARKSCLTAVWVLIVEKRRKSGSLFQRLAVYCFYTILLDADDHVGSTAQMGFARQARKPVVRLAMTAMSAERVRHFLDKLEKKRGWAIATRNQRLAAIHARAKFIGLHAPELVKWARCQAVGYAHNKGYGTIGWNDNRSRHVARNTLCVLSRVIRPQLVVASVQVRHSSN
jgi:hypothetical protein